MQVDRLKHVLEAYDLNQEEGRSSTSKGQSRSLSLSLSLCFSLAFSPSLSRSHTRSPMSLIESVGFFRTHTHIYTHTFPDIGQRRCHSKFNVCVWCICLQILDRGGASALPRRHSKLWAQGRQSDRVCGRHPKRNTGFFFECDVCVRVCAYVYICICVPSPFSAHVTRYVCLESRTRGTYCVHTWILYS